jgi:hypothetical protein
MIKLKERLTSEPMLSTQNHEPPPKFHRLVILCLQASAAWTPWDHGIRSFGQGHVHTMSLVGLLLTVYTAGFRSRRTSGDRYLQKYVAQKRMPSRR